MASRRKRFMALNPHACHFSVKRRSAISVPLHHRKDRLQVQLQLSHCPVQVVEQYLGPGLSVLFGLLEAARQNRTLAANMALVEVLGYRRLNLRALHYQLDTTSTQAYHKFRPQTRTFQLGITIWPRYIPEKVTLSRNPRGFSRNILPSFLRSPRPNSPQPSWAPSCHKLTIVMPDGKKVVLTLEWCILHRRGHSRDPQQLAMRRLSPLTRAREDPCNPTMESMKTLPNHLDGSPPQTMRSLSHSVQSTLPRLLRCSTRRSCLRIPTSPL